RLVTVLSDRAAREAGGVTQSLRRLWEKIAPSIDAGHCAVFSGASGAEPATGEERAFLAGLGGAVRAPGRYVGHGAEPQFSLNAALATLALSHGAVYPSRDRTGAEKDMDGKLTQVVITGVGHWRGEGLALIEAVES